MKNRYCAIIMASVFSAMSFTANACESFDYEFEMQLAKDSYNTCLRYDHEKNCFDDYIIRVNEIEREETAIHLENLRNEYERKRNASAK